MVAILPGTIPHGFCEKPDPPCTSLGVSLTARLWGSFRRLCSCRDRSQCVCVFVCRALVCQAHVQRDFDQETSDDETLNSSGSNCIRWWNISSKCLYSLFEVFDIKATRDSL